MNGVALITRWVRQFCGRDPSPVDIANGEAMQTPEDAYERLAEVASCDEAYANLTEHAYGGWFEYVYWALARREPMLTDQSWAHAIMMASPGMPGRTNVVRGLIRQYPPPLDFNPDPPRPPDPDPHPRPPEPPHPGPHPRE
jgi:hypothetical protein